MSRALPVFGSAALQFSDGQGSLLVGGWAPPGTVVVMEEGYNETAAADGSVTEGQSERTGQRKVAGGIRVTPKAVVGTAAGIVLVVVAVLALVRDRDTVHSADVGFSNDQIFAPPMSPTREDLGAGIAVSVAQVTKSTGGVVEVGLDPAVVVFVSHWCGDRCEEQVKALGGVGAKGVKVYVVSTFATEGKPGWPGPGPLRKWWDGTILVDSDNSDLATRWGVIGAPVVVGVRDGVLVSRHWGPLDRAALQNLADLVGSPPVVDVAEAEEQ